MEMLYIGTAKLAGLSSCQILPVSPTVEAMELFKKVALKKNNGCVLTFK